MKKAFFLSAAVALMGVSAPAAAQGYDRGYGYDRDYDRGYDRDYDRGYGRQYGDASREFEARIQAGIRSGAITRREANYLFHKVGQLRDHERKLSRVGYDRGGARVLRTRIQGLERSLREYERNGQYAGSRRYDDRYDGRRSPDRAWD